MTANKQIIIACLRRAAAATAIFAVHIVAVHTVAQAQVSDAIPNAALLGLPDVTPVAASAATPAAMPAVTLPGVRPAASDMSKPAAPIPAAPVISPQTACRAPAELAHLDHPLLRMMRRLASGQPLIIVAIGSSSTAGASSELTRGKLSEPACRRA